MAIQYISNFTVDVITRHSHTHSHEARTKNARPIRSVVIGLIYRGIAMPVGYFWLTYALSPHSLRYSTHTNTVQQFQNFEHTSLRLVSHLKKLHYVVGCFMAKSVLKFLYTFKANRVSLEMQVGKRHFIHSNLFREYLDLLSLYSIPNRVQYILKPKELIYAGTYVLTLMYSGKWLLTSDSVSIVLFSSWDDLRVELIFWNVLRWEIEQRNLVVSICTH